MTIGLRVCAVLLASLDLTAGVEFASLRLYEVDGAASVQTTKVLATRGGDTLVLGYTSNQRLATSGPACKPTPGANLCAFISRVSREGYQRCFRYLPFEGIGTAALGPNDDLWVRVGKPERLDFSFVSFADFGYSADMYARISLDDLTVQVTVAVSPFWFEPPDQFAVGPWHTAAAVDAVGGLWLAGHSTRQRPELPVTQDAAQPFIVGGAASLAQRRYPGTLMRIAPDGSRITYATYLGDSADTVSKVVIDQQGNVYAVGSRIWKFSVTGKLVWSTWLPSGAALTAAIGPAGDLFVAGCTTAAASSFFTTAGAFQRDSPVIQEFPPPRLNYYPRQCFDGFVTRMSSDGNIVYSTLLGLAAGNLVNYLAVNSRSEVFCAGLLAGLNRDQGWAGTTRMARLTADGSALLYATGFPGWQFGQPNFVSDGDQVTMAATTQYRAVDGSYVGFVAIDRVIERPSRPRLDKVSLTGSLTSGFRLELFGNNFCELPSVLVEDREYPVDVLSTTGLAFSFDSRQQPPLPNALDAGDEVHAYYAIRVRCDGETSTPMFAAIPYRTRTTP